MRRRWILFPFCLLFSPLLFHPSNARATTLLRVNETAVTCRFVDRSARLSLAVENPSPPITARIRLELLDPQDQVRAKVERDETIRPGLSSLSFDLPLEFSRLGPKERHELLWYRLRYRIMPLSSTGPLDIVEGLVSLSAVTPDIFTLRVMDYGIAREGLRYHTRVRAAHPISEQAVAGVKVSAELSFGDGEEKRVLRAAGVTDRTGYASFVFELPRGLTTDEGKLRVRAVGGDYVQEAEDDIMLDTMPRILITTDKPLYQPGQMLHARALVFDSTMHALAEDEAGLTITDPDRTTLFRAALKTSRFGVASADWPIPENARLGEYEINIIRRGEQVSSYRFKISRYELPTFTVNVKPDRAFYLPGQDAQVEVHARYLFGRDVGRGRVRVVREKEREWDYRKQEWKTEEGETYEGETDAQGRFIAHVKLREELEELKDSDYARLRDLTYAAYFTDLSTNRTEERRFDLRITKAPVHIYVIQGGDYQNALHPLNFYLSTFYADGSPAECEVTISEDPDEDDERAGERARAGRGLRTVTTNAYGLAKIEDLTVEKREAEDDAIKLSFAARDRQGRSGRQDETIWTREGDVVRVETDKTIYRAGESIRATITAGRKDATVFVDVVQDWRLLRTETVLLRDGRASLTLPYSEDFKDKLSIVAYGDRSDPYRSHGTRTVLFPRERRLKLDVQAAQDTYRPGEEAQVDFLVRAAEGRASSSALGVVVFDKAVEERMRTDAAFGSGGGSRHNGNTTVPDMLGETEELAGVRLGDLNRLNLSQAVPKDLELLAEIMLNKSSSYYPRAFSGEDFETNAAAVYAEPIKTRLTPVNLVLGLRYKMSAEYPADEPAFRRALKESGINFDAHRDPWGTPFRPRFFVDRMLDSVQIISAGTDKQFDTDDDMIALSMGWPYFRQTGETIDRAVRDYHVRTGRFIRDARTLGKELLRAGLDRASLVDRWGRPYRFQFGVSGTTYVLKIESGGADFGPASRRGRSYGNEFTIWVNEMNYFAEPRARIDRALAGFLEAQKRLPKNDAELAQALEKAKLGPTVLRDGWGRRGYAVFKNRLIHSNRASMEDVGRYGEALRTRTVMTPVTETLYQVVLRSSGPDGKQGTYDDFTLGDFSYSVAEQAARDKRPNHSRSVASFYSANGAISGVVTDPAGAIIEGVSVKATHLRTLQVFEDTTNSEGRYMLRNLLPGVYTVTFDAVAFKRVTITEVAVASSSITDLPVQMSVATITETVSVTAESSQALQTLSASVSQRTAEIPKSRETAGRGQASTPRLREYFPETLVWQPSIETDEQGRAQLRFKLADNITTWKVAVIGSTVDGDLGTAEHEITAFQPFFVEHDPPRVLTEGDRVALPVVLRNYLDKGLSVDLSIKPEDWFELLGPSHKRASVAPGDNARETFDFRATASIKEGRQRITATATEASDQIEKPVSVHPDGEEREQTVSRLLTDQATLEWVIPAEALRGTSRAEVKLYPNLLTHVMESVEAIMRRPYGCAEQTISSSYPSLLVLRRDKQSGTQSAIAKKALRYVAAGYERLLNYRMDDGGFSYWGYGESDLALTAYALRFLNDAKDFVAVDEEVLTKARAWLVERQRPDGSWPTYSYHRSNKENVRAVAMLTSYVARVVAATRQEDEKKDASVPDHPSKAPTNALRRALDYLAPRVKAIDEPYLVASYALAAIEAKLAARAREAVERLRVLAKEEAGISYWALETNTPFYGWGLAGRIETTALAVQALSRLKEAERESKAAATGATATASAARQGGNDSRLVNQGLLFLLQQKDRYGVWYSTQATVNVLDAMIALLASPQTDARASLGPDANGQAEIIVNGNHAASPSLSGENSLDNPLTVDVSKYLTAGRNFVEIRRAQGSPQATVQVVSTYYVPWPATTGARGAAAGQHGAAALRLGVRFDKTEARVGEEVTCSVRAERAGHHGYGMMLVEVGLPPGADVDRASLEQALKNSGRDIGRYDVLPDRLIFYLWPRAVETRFEFKFRPRFGMAARTAPSLIYDYYNPEARTLVAPTDFIVR
jgi:A-macroglobulin TED domain/MG2 domain/Alpha-2-macroglobulin family/Carboxypeptidase regulatory-like domain/A-macroglobulin receptor binding domain/Macroglobulin domain MG3/Alpha-2-macroglobulin bait region domain